MPALRRAYGHAVSLVPCALLYVLRLWMRGRSEFPSRRKTTVKKLLLLFPALLLIFAFPAQAQTPTPPAAPAPSTLFSFSTQAVAISLGGSTTPGTDVVGQFYLTKNNVLESDNMLFPGNGMQAYLGGIRRNFSLASLIKNTNIPANTFLPYVHGAVGVIRWVPSTGPAVQRIGAIADGGFDYDPTGSAKFGIGPRVGWIYAPGNPGSTARNGVLVSANLTFVLGAR
jgi:hypothetical protein